MALTKVSILIPCYNAEKWIAQCIESALNQTYPHKEVIVVDDGSTDGSLDIIKSFGDNIRWETGPNRGGNVARNRLLELSSGEWLQYLDADDYLLPNKIEEQIKVLQKEPNADVICSPAIAEYHEGEKIWRGSSASLHPRDPWILLAKWALPQTGGSLWRKQALLEVGGWKADQTCCQEHELYCRLLMNSKKFAYLDESLAVYRLWSNLTVSRKDARKPYHYRLLIKDALETYLNQMNMLTEERRYEIYAARFECARSVYQFDQDWALSIISKIRTQYPEFIPCNQSGSRFYTTVYLLGGFLFAEKLAQLYRTLSIVLKKFSWALTFIKIIKMKQLLSKIVSKGISILNNHTPIDLKREEFRTIKFSFSQYGEDLIVYNLLKARDPLSGYFVDAGCYHPFHLSTTNLLYRYGWRGINIDLDPKRLALFDTYRPGDIQTVAALSHTEEEVLYLKYSEPLLDRILPLTSTNKTDVASLGVQPISEQIIKTQLLTKILDQYPVSNQRFDYLNVDCEGNDLRVVQGLDFTRFRPYLITIEANSLDQKNKIISFLESQDYKYHFALGVTLLFISLIND